MEKCPQNGSGEKSTSFSRIKKWLRTQNPNMRHIKKKYPIPLTFSKKNGESWKNTKDFIKMLSFSMHIPLLSFYFFFLWQRYRTCSLIAPLCILQADSHSGWLLAFVHPSKPPSQTRAVGPCKGKKQTTTSLLPSGQMCFEVRGSRAIASSRFPTTITLQCFPVFCCCSVFNGFVLSCFLHQHEE